MNITITLSNADRREWERRARRNLRTLTDELSFTLKRAVESGFADSSLILATAASIAPSPTDNGRRAGRMPPAPETHDDEPIADWMIDTNNRSGFKGVHQNGSRWRALVNDPKTGYSIRLEGFPTARAAALARQRHFIANSMPVPHRGRATKPKKTREDREAEALAAGLSPELAAKAVMDLDEVLGGKYFAKDRDLDLGDQKPL